MVRRVALEKLHYTLACMPVCLYACMPLALLYAAGDESFLRFDTQLVSIHTYQPSYSVSQCQRV